MNATDKVYCWACSREVPATDLTPGGRHDEGKGGCGCYIDRDTNHRIDGGKTREQVAFEAGYLAGATNEAFDITCDPEVAYKKWKEESR
jgi:hypothetical protein